ncbi:SURF1 family-domain-containing protein [Obelidium mucronatum]|nr:SURF1 family-domain-containing protein [Obelidium mucronatum]
MNLIKKRLFAFLGHNTKRHFTSAATPRLGGPETQSSSPLLWLFPVVTFGLGVWQVQRLQWKLTLIDQVREKLKAPAEPFSDFLNGTMANIAGIDDDLQFRKFKVKGEFVEGADLYVGPRTRGAAADTDTARGLAHNPVGYFVYSPFDVEQSQVTGPKPYRVLVNRGWIPRDSKTLESQSKRKISGPVEIEVVLRTGENPSSFPTNDPKSNQWYSIDVDGMAEWTKSDAIVMDMISNSAINAPLLEREGAPLARNGTNIQLKNDHLVYAITWFGMCGISALMIRNMGRKSVGSGLGAVGKGRKNFF